MQHEGRVQAIAFSPDGHRLATVSNHDEVNVTAHLWDAITASPIGVPMQHRGHIVSVSFSPDGARLATASRDKTACLWDASTGAPLGDPMRHDSGVDGLVFSPDGSRIVTTSEAKTTALWDVEAIVPQDIDSLINRFAKEPDPSLPFDTEFQARLDKYHARRNLQYRASAATKAVAEQNWHAAALHLHWLCKQVPNGPQWQSMLAHADAQTGKKSRKKDKTPDR